MYAAGGSREIPTIRQFYQPKQKPWRHRDKFQPVKRNARSFSGAACSLPTDMATLQSGPPPASELFNPVTAILQRPYQAMVTDQVPGTDDHEIITIAPEEGFYLR